jgi:isopentenyl phosphate kinase
MSELIFLKFGGSLITNKDKVAAPRLDVLSRLANEIAAARKAQPELKLVLGHGSGSFGHVPAKKFGTREGVKTKEQWSGFIEVWRQASALNRIVMDALGAAGLQAIAFPPSATISAQDGKVKNWNIEPIQAALGTNLLPVIYGDVVFDSVRGGTILSTEDLFLHLGPILKPTHILLAGDEEGIFSDYPARKSLVELITPKTFSKFAPALGSAAGADVTGGMAGKVSAMLELVKGSPSCKVRIFSGMQPGAVEKAFAGGAVGTLLRAD